MGGLWRRCMGLGLLTGLAAVLLTTAGKVTHAANLMSRQATQTLAKLDQETNHRAGVLGVLSPLLRRAFTWLEMAHDWPPQRLEPTVHELIGRIQGSAECHISLVDADGQPSIHAKSMAATVQLARSQVSHSSATPLRPTYP